MMSGSSLLTAADKEPGSASAPASRSCLTIARSPNNAAPLRPCCGSAPAFNSNPMISGDPWIDSNLRASNFVRRRRTRSKSGFNGLGVASFLSLQQRGLRFGGTGAADQDEDKRDGVVCREERIKRLLLAQARATFSAW